MINYTECITLLMQDIVARVPALSFINLDRVLVFARYGRTHAEGPYATCHSLNLPNSEPGYYYWRDRQTGEITRCSEWFVTKSPLVIVNGGRIEYLISFGLPRFCEQSLQRSRKEVHYAAGTPAWLAKLDTIVHELYHIDPVQPGIRRLGREDGNCSQFSHSAEFFEHVSRLVKVYLATKPDPARYDFLRHSFSELTRRFGGVIATTFRNFPSFPQRYIEACRTDDAQPQVKVEPVKRSSQPAMYTEADLDLREFFEPAAETSAPPAPRPSPGVWSRRLRPEVLDSRPTAASRRR